MGWIFRKSVNLGPFRINLSKSGVGGSFGIGPFRIGRSASGRGYTSTRIPGTGISYRTSSGGSADGKSGGGGGCGCGCILLILGLLAAAVLVALVMRTGSTSGTGG
jgi:hypothetical protein